MPYGLHTSGRPIVLHRQMWVDHQARGKGHNSSLGLEGMDMCACRRSLSISTGPYLSNNVCLGYSAIFSSFTAPSLTGHGAFALALKFGESKPMQCFFFFPNSLWSIDTS
ncbi:hypothetical protein HL42_6600 [Trichophyton rubrum]|nr:hypothetical protein HL42_6600 [Trichophyton rubrum]